MQGQFQIRANYFGNHPIVKLSHPEANELLRAIQAVSAFLELEELYDAIVDDYVETEEAMLGAALAYTVRKKCAIEHFGPNRRLFNRRLMHLLSLTRTYLDVAPRVMGVLENTEDALKAQFKTLAAAQYDAKLGYRAMEAFRNSAQHWGLPLHGITMGGKWVEEQGNDKGSLRHHAVGTISIEELRKNPKIKSEIVDELSVYGKKADLRPLIREYVQGISELHDGVRTEVRSAVDKSRNLKAKSIGAWKSKSRGRSKAIGLCIVEMRTKHTWSIVEYLNQNAEKEIDSLQQANQKLIALSKSFVSNSAERNDI